MTTDGFHDSGRAADAVVTAFERELAELSAPTPAVTAAAPRSGSDLDSRGDNVGR
jgi:hypothetical protein